MNTERLHESLSPQEYATLFDAAKVRATELRRAAISGFCSAVARGARSRWRAIRRAMPSSSLTHPLDA